MELICNITSANCSYFVLTAITRGRFYVQFEDPPVHYLIDSASLKEIVPNPNWRQEADARIENIRKRDIHIRYVTRNGEVHAN